MLIRIETELIDSRFNGLSFKQNFSFSDIKLTMFFCYFLNRLFQQETIVGMRINNSARKNYLDALDSVYLSQRTKFQLQSYFEHNDILQVRIINLKLIYI